MRCRNVNINTHLDSLKPFHTRGLNLEDYSVVLFFVVMTLWATIDLYTTTAYLKKHNFLESSELDEIGS